MPKEPKTITHDPEAVEEAVEQAVERQYAKKIVRPDPGPLSDEVDEQDPAKG